MPRKKKLNSPGKISGGGRRGGGAGRPTTQPPVEVSLLPGGAKGPHYGHERDQKKALEEEEEEEGSGMVEPDQDQLTVLTRIS